MMRWFNRKQTEKQPVINVGILAVEELHFSFSGNFFLESEVVGAGDFAARVENGKIVVRDDSGNTVSAEMFLFEPASYNAAFELKNTTIGIGFHWEQKENQWFKGSLQLIPEDGKVRAINRIELEEYLKSVISSEMSATCSLALLKAHAVISRSWLLAQIRKTTEIKAGGGIYQTSHENEQEIIRWYDREDHRNFDVCADDHCQRYQGITKIHSESAMKAVAETSGEVLLYDGKICDARFSKCCGGITENFENVWEPVAHPYLTMVIDNHEFPAGFDLNLTGEKDAEKWICSNPPAFCNTSDQKVLSQVLPGFDQVTTDFYRWKVEYTQAELARIIREKSGLDFGEIKKLVPVQRGRSGRIIKLKIEGTRKTLTVGKELEIRKWLSESHLYSSAFVVDHLETENGIPQKFVITGAGWGHGVGLCQIGAAMMGEKGYDYNAILSHYFKGAKLKKIYEP